MKSSILRTYYLVVFFSVWLLSACDDRRGPDASLEEIAREFNKKCPQMIDSETRIEGIQIKKPNTIVYKYTLINLPSQNVDTNEFKKNLRPGIISLIKLSPEMKLLRENKTNFEYQYVDKLNKAIYTFKIFPKDYNP